MTSFAGDERNALCDLFTELGPEAPTLCEGWLTYDLVAHLVVRERNMFALPGYIMPSFTERSNRIQAEFKAEHSYTECVRILRQGAPSWNPLGLPLIRETANLLEFLIHHEDVRRAQPNWQPRTVSRELLDAVWAKVRPLARLAFVRLPVGLVLQRETGEIVWARRKPEVVTVVGDPIELALFAFNRREVAKVELRGTDDAIGKLRVSRSAL